MSSKSNNQGRAYEYICLHTLNNAIGRIRNSEIEKNSCYEAAEHAWNTLSGAEKALYTLSAKSTIDTIFALEPNIIEKKMMSSNCIFKVMNMVKLQMFVTL